MGVGVDRAGNDHCDDHPAHPSLHPTPNPSPSRGGEPRWRQTIGAFLLSAAFGFSALVAVANWPGLPGVHAQQAQPSLAQLKVKFARPTFIPSPADNPPSAAKVALGKRLFEDAELSSTGTIACRSCHDPKLALADGEPTGKGVTGKPLVRHTPTLWNLAWSPLLFWDGRARSLEDQVRFPIEHADEMGSTLEAGAVRLQRHASYVEAFKQAFPQDPRITPDNVAKALAAYERTLVSPPTRFDKWIAGDAAALTASEVNGFAIFTGKGRCSNCHTGFAFTDHGFYDIGLPSEDLGRGPIIGLKVADHAFKVPTLRELAWTAPYMHDGSLATLDDVVRIYEMGGLARPTRAKDLPDIIRLTDQERADLIAFLESLSSETPPQPSREAWVDAPTPRVPVRPRDTTVVSQSDKLFSPPQVRIRESQPLTVLNDDTRTHNVRIFDPRFDFNSGAQEPHEAVTIRFPGPGTFEAFCGIHPTMRLTVVVE
jgi:cytochrome c peroxidase